VEDLAHAQTNATEAWGFQRQRKTRQIARNPSAPHFENEGKGVPDRKACSSGSDFAGVLDCAGMEKQLQLPVSLPVSFSSVLR